MSGRVYRPRRSAPRKKEYVAVFYDMETDREIGRTKASEPMTQLQAEKYIEWAIKDDLHARSFYGLAVKLQDKLYTKQDLLNALTEYIGVLTSDLRRETSVEVSQVLTNVIRSLNGLKNTFKD